MEQKADSRYDRGSRPSAVFVALTALIAGKAVAAALPEYVRRSATLVLASWSVTVTIRHDRHRSRERSDNGCRIPAQAPSRRPLPAPVRRGHRPLTLSPGVRRPCPAKSQASSGHGVLPLRNPSLN